MKRIQRISSIAARALGLLLALALLAGALPQPAAAQTSNCAKRYTVVAGDTASGVADSNNITLAELAAANTLKDPYGLVVGQSLCIPGATTTTTTTTGTTTSTSKDKKVATLTLDDFNSSLQLNIANYSKNATYYVRIAEKARKPVYYKVGRVRVDKAGNGSLYFKLPDAIDDGNIFIICLKNAVNNSNSCKTIRR